MVKDVLDPQEFEWQSNQENVVRRITALNGMEPTPQIDPPRVQELPKERPAVLV